MPIVLGQLEILAGVWVARVRERPQRAPESGRARERVAQSVEHVALLLDAVVAIDLEEEEEVAWRGELRRIAEAAVVGVVGAEQAICGGRNKIDAQRSGRIDAPESETGDFEIPEDQKEAREQAKKWRAEAARAVPDVRVADGDVLNVGSLRLRCVHAPGHTAGHLCILLEDERVLFAGDNVLGVGTAAIGPPPNGDMAEYVRSLRKMQTLDAELLAPGHGPLVREPNRKIQELIDHRQQREEQIAALVADGRRDAKSLVKAIYPELDKRLVWMATGQVLSHLHKLQAEGKLKLEGTGPETRVVEA